MNSKSRNIISAAFAAAFFAFWMWGFPQGLNYQEQNQMFLWTWDYLAGRLSVCGGLADWISEFIVQFFYIKWLGALVLALLFAALQLAVAGENSRRAWGLSFVPPVLLLVYMGDCEVLVSYAVALCISALLCHPFEKIGWHKLWAAPLLWWLVGPVAILPVLWALAASRRMSDIVSAIWALVAAYLIYRLFLMQWTPRDAMFGLNYYRLVESLPALQIIIPAGVLLCLAAIRWIPDLKAPAVTNSAIIILTIAAGALGISANYDKDTWTMLAFDDRTRNGEYDKVLAQAEKHQPGNSVSATYVNFALMNTGKGLEKLPEYWQSGTNGLIMPSVRDNLSDIASCEALWMMGMNNTALQYAFDLQESIQNGRKSGRFTSRIAECHIVNGDFNIALRYLDKLTHTTFYRKWAEERIDAIKNGGIYDNPVYRYLQFARPKDDYIVNYEAMDVMVALLYRQSPQNMVAAWYFNAWQMLKTAEQHKNEETQYTGTHGS